MLKVITVHYVHVIKSSLVNFGKYFWLKVFVALNIVVIHINVFIFHLLISSFFFFLFSIALRFAAVAARCRGSRAG